MAKNRNENAANSRVLRRNHVAAMNAGMQISFDPANPPVFITAAEAARILRVSSKWFYEQMRDGSGPRAVMIGKKKYRIAYADFEKWCKKSPKRKAV